MKEQNQVEDKNRQAEELLDEAERAIKASEEINRELLGMQMDRNVNAFVTKSCPEIESFLTNGQGEFESEAFIDNMFKAVEEEDRINGGQQSLGRVTGSTAPIPVVSSAVAKVAAPSDSLMKQYRKMPEQKRKKDASRQKVDEKHK